MRVLGQYAQEAVSLAATAPGFFRAGCGLRTGDSFAPRRKKSSSRVTAIDFSPKMVSIFKKDLKEKAIRHVKVHHGDGQALPFENNSFDAAFSMFGLMFFPDRPKGFAELYRTLKPGGRAVVSSWAPISRSPSMKAMFGALRAMNPDMPEPRKAMKSLEDPKVFREEMSGAGFTNVRILPVRKTVSHNLRQSLLDDEMVEGSAPTASRCARSWAKKRGKSGKNSP